MRAPASDGARSAVCSTSPRRIESPHIEIGHVAGSAAPAFKRSDGSLGDPTPVGSPFNRSTASADSVLERKPAGSCKAKCHENARRAL